MALEILRASGRSLPRLNVRIAGEEADLSWPDARLIVEIDGGPFHLDRGEDARKQRRWERAGWIVRRISSDEVYESPERLLALAPNVPGYPPERKLRDVRQRASQ
jgi:very-short-patch-repair endonuclease